MIAPHFDEEDLAMATPIPPFDREKLDSEHTSMLKEVRKYGLHHDKQFMDAFNGYVGQLYQNGEDLNQGKVPQAGGAAEKLIEEFDRLNAFHVPSQWYRDTYKKGKEKWGRDGKSLEKEFAKAREKKAAETGKYLWSKTEPYHPARKAAEDGAMILETSLPGKIFNGRTGGVKNWSDAPVQERLWQHMSGHYVDGAHGPVTAVMLEGRVAGSVLTKYEWPRLKELIKAGKVPHLHVKLMGIRGDKKNSETWSLTTKESFDVHSQGSFDRIPSPDGKDFKEKQSRWRERELGRNARGKSSSPSSSSDGSSSSNHSLDTFHKVFDDPNAVVVLWDPYAGNAQFTESPKQLSRSGSSEFPQASTEGMTREQRRQATIDAVRGELAAEAQGKHSMDQKIANFTAEQAERRTTGSASAWPSVQGAQEDVNYDHRLAEGVSHMGLGSSSGERSPMESSPGVRLGPETSSYFSPGAVAGGTQRTEGSQYGVHYDLDPRYVHSSQPTIGGQEFAPTHQGESAYGHESYDHEHYDYPPSPVQQAQTFDTQHEPVYDHLPTPVHNAQAYNPSSGDPQNRTPSTASDSSGGVDLTHSASDSSGGVQLTQDRPSSEKKPKPRPKAKETSGWDNFLKGGRRR
ncbi:hypothetical protein [Streptomyces sp. NPDC060065]|uniref:hypothetical protein n=1 Tax=Streptomyces sp. NPDC060065 TaxID=3347050 RepID=UPI00367BBDB8